MSFPSPIHNAGRAAAVGVKLAQRGSGNLPLASFLTISFIFGMVLALCVPMVFIFINSEDPKNGLIIALAITIIFNLAIFFISVFLMDLIQNSLYGTCWVSLAEIESQSPEAAQVIQRVCREKNIKVPRLGIIEDQNPTAFTYGSLPNSARLVVSRGIFTYLDDDEVAAVYAHELGHIVHWDFALMTLASTLVQICYQIYFTFRSIYRRSSNKGKDIVATLTAIAYVFYLIGNYLLLYLSRTREYSADHFAAETTGNPNALSRALVKIAYGILEEGKRQKEPSHLLEGTRALGIYDPKAATLTGTAYRVASEPAKIGRVFLWDLFNPWGWWMELNSTHPLTGKRVRALSNYAEQLGIDIEYDMGRVVSEGNRLSKAKLYGNFLLDIALYCAETIGYFGGLFFGFFAILFGNLDPENPFIVFAYAFIGLGLGILCKMLVRFPNYDQAQTSDVLTLMSDPYASPLRGKPTKLKGTLIGREDAGYAFGSDLQFQDKTGMMYLHYTSRLGPIGNFLFGMKRVKSLIGMQVNTVGWFRRGVAPSMDLIQLESKEGTVVNSYHRFWSLLLAIGSIAVGIAWIFFKIPT